MPCYCLPHDRKSLMRSKYSASKHVAYFAFFLNKRADTETKSATLIVVLLIRGKSKNCEDLK